MSGNLNEFQYLAKWK